MNSKGMTLVELVAVLAVVGILVVIAVPALQRMMEHQRRLVIATELTNALRTARIEAILRQSPIVIRAIRGKWARGWTISIDSRGMRNGRVFTLQTHILDGRTPIIGNKWLAEEVRFNRLGAPAGDGNQSHIGSLFLCDSRLPLMRIRIVLDWVGRVRVTDQLERGFTDACARPIKR